MFILQLSILCLLHTCYSFKHSATPVLCTDDPGDLVVGGGDDDSESLTGQGGKSLKEAENEYCGLQQVVS